MIKYRKKTNMNKAISATIIAAVLALSFTADAKVTRVPRWVHGFQLGAALSTHRQSCKNLKGEWDYRDDTCNHPVINKFGSPTFVAFGWSWTGEELSRKGVRFIYTEMGYFNKWLEYCHSTFGEPEKLSYDNGRWDYRWELDDGMINVGSLFPSEDGSIPNGYKVSYSLYEAINR